MLMDKCNLTKTGIIKGKALSIELLGIASYSEPVAYTRK